MEYRYNDGGRADAGFKGTCGDCGTRAIAIATGLPYKDVYYGLAELVKASNSKKIVKRRAVRGNTVRNGTPMEIAKQFMANLGWQWIPTMSFGSGCKVHLSADELPNGNLVVRLSKHLCAVIDGVINDIYDPNDRGVATDAFGNDITTDRCVYGYWRKSAI